MYVSIGKLLHGGVVVPNKGGADSPLRRARPEHIATPPGTPMQERWVDHPCLNRDESNPASFPMYPNAYSNL